MFSNDDQVYSKVRQLTLALLVFVMPASLAAQEKPTSIAVAAAAVESNMKTAEGKSYDGKIGEAFEKKYPSVVKACKDKAAGDFSGFDMLVRVAQTGAVKEVLLFPPTKMSQCLRPTLLTDAFPPPPKADYWVDIHLDLKH